VLEEGVRQFGHLDVVVANAGIMPMGIENPMDFVDAPDVDLIGVMNTVAASIPHLPDGASIIITGSNAGLMPGTTDSGAMGAGGAGYAWAKRTLVGYAEQMALALARRMIRVNAVHPTNVNTHLIHNKELYQVFRPDLETRRSKTSSRRSPTSRPCRFPSSSRSTPQMPSFSSRPTTRVT
jgi:NAD(P)-dependent dehydrogenase (short-subunit alcohol dehydrogenase family)